MKRREFIEKAGIGSAAFVTLPALKGDPKTADRKDGAGAQEHDHGNDRDRDEPKGSLANITISFGAWDTETPLDRFPNNSPRERNYHHLLPFESIVKAGGAVNFIISGFHHVLVYGNRTKPEDINRTILVPSTLPGGPPLIADATNRVYRGLDPGVMPLLPGSTPPQPMQDRVEVVRFPNRGRYLVICGVLPHFFDAATGQFIMFGYIRVV